MRTVARVVCGDCESMWNEIGSRVAEVATPASAQTGRNSDVRVVRTWVYFRVRESSWVFRTSTEPLLLNGIGSVIPNDRLRRSI